MLISASTNPPPINKLDEYLSQLSTLPVDLVHCDIMDGCFVPATTFDYTLLPHIYNLTNKPLDVHVMAQDIEKTYSNYLTAGVKDLTIHYEAVENKDVLKSILLDIKSRGFLAGLAIKPSTALDEVSDVLPVIDILLIMSVEPGKSYQKFLDDTFLKIQECAHYRQKYALDFMIEVDGGVNAENAPRLKAIGVDMVVVGGFLYNSTDRLTSIKSLNE